MSATVRTLICMAGCNVVNGVLTKAMSDWRTTYPKDQFGMIVVPLGTFIYYGILLMVMHINKHTTNTGHTTPLFVCSARLSH